MQTRSHRMRFGAELVGDDVRFRLWAPAARSVDVEVDGRRFRSDAGPGGWFERTAPARGGSRYSFVIDGERRVADPASRFQPDGVDGPSEVVDPAAYAWSNDRQRPPWRELVFYELHVGTFTPEGTYRGAIARLDDLVRLGITAIELMPLGEAPGLRDWGYDGVYPYAPESAYGRPEDLKALVDAAHARGLAVFLDVVYNHFGPEGNALHHYAPQFFTDQRHTPWGSAIDFERQPEVREFFAHNALYWLEEFAFDGLRIDAVHAIFDESERSVLKDVASRMAALGAATDDGRAYAVLENDFNDSVLLRSYAAQWDDDVHHAFHVLLTGERGGYYADYVQQPARHLGRALTQGFAYQGEPSAFRGGAPRGTPSHSLPPTAFVNFLQNHDQIGNRALGERIGHLVELYKVRAAAAVLLLAPGLPLIFMGEEWAASTPFLFFCDFGPDLAARVREGRRREFASFPEFVRPSDAERIPDPCDEQTFRRSALDWSERSREPHRSMLEFYRDALYTRRQHVVPLLAQRCIATAFATIDDAPGALAARWTFEAGATLSVIANLQEARVDRLGFAAFDHPRVAPIFAVSAPGEPAPGLATLLGGWSVAWWLVR